MWNGTVCCLVGAIGAAYYTVTTTDGITWAAPVALPLRGMLGQLLVEAIEQGLQERMGLQITGCARPRVRRCCPNARPPP